MAAVAFQCDQPGCQATPVAFGFPPHSSKTKVCALHRSALSETESVFDIAAFQFIETEADIPLYQQVQALSQRGLEHLSALETHCEHDWKEAQHKLQTAEADLIEVIRRCYREMHSRTEQRYEEAKKELKQRHSNLHLITRDKQFRLSPAETALCESVPTGSLFHLVLGDSSLAVAEALLANFHLLPPVGTVQLDSNRRSESIAAMVRFAQEKGEQGRADIAEEICEYVETLGPTLCPDFKAEAVKNREQAADKLRFLLPDQADGQEAQQVAAKFVAAGKEAREDGDYERAMNQLQRCKGLLKQRKLENPELCLELGLTYSHFAQRAEAEAVLRHGLELQPGSDIALQLCTALAEGFFQVGRWAEIETICGEALLKWGSEPHSFELMRAVYYLANAYFLQNEIAKGLAVIREWEERLHADNPKSQCAQLFIRAEKLRVEGSQEPRLYEEAIQLAEQVLPNSYLTACARRRLGMIYKAQHQLEKAEEQWLRACETHACHYPRSLGHAMCLSHLGQLRKLMKKPEEAEALYLQACQIYSTHFPHNLNYAICLNNLALLYESIKGPEQVEEQYLKACQIYSAHYAHTLDYAICLANLGDLYKSLRLFDKAEERYLQASPIFEAHPPGLSFAHLLFSLGLLYEAKGRKEEAAARLERALKIYAEKQAHHDASRCEAALKHLRS